MAEDRAGEITEGRGGRRQERPGTWDYIFRKEVVGPMLNVGR